MEDLAELDDAPQTLGDWTPPIDVSALTEPIVRLAIAGIVVGLAILVWPSGSSVPATLLGAIFLLVAGGSLLAMRRQRRTRRGASIASLLAAVLGVLLLVSPNWRSPVTDQLVTILINVTVTAWVVLSGIVIVTSFDGRSDETTTYAGAARVIRRWITARPRSATSRQELYSQILYTGPSTGSTVKRFLILMGLAASIASMGVIADSTVAVLAGMLIAPLMLPMMGMAASLVMGWPRRLVRLSLITTAGIVVTVGVGLLLGFVHPSLIDTATNTQITSRVVPTISDLAIAIAAGAAGAYALSRPDVSNSLPGAAVAISLVPPLTVAGVALSQGDLASTTGALLLFATNTLAILIMGSVVFILTGIAPVRRATTTRRQVRLWLAVGTSALLVGALLLLNGAELQSTGAEIVRVEAVVNDWLIDSEHYAYDVEIVGDTVTAVVIGPDTDIIDTSELATDLSAQLGRTITVEALFLVGELSTSTGE